MIVESGSGRTEGGEVDVEERLYSGSGGSLVSMTAQAR